MDGALFATVRRVVIGSIRLSLPVLGAFALSRSIAWLIFPLYDDAFITYRHAANLVAFGLYTYNVDDFVLGTTAPLFGFVAIPLLTLQAFPTAALPLFNVLVDVAIVCLTWPMLRSRSCASCLLFAGIYGLMPLAARITVGGMEANLFVLATVAALRLQAVDRGPVAGAVAALAYFLRPESALTIVIMSIREIVRSSWSGLLRLLVPSAVILSVGIGVLWLVYGSPLPQSILAKSAHLHAGVLEVLGQLLFPDPVTVILLPLTVLGAVATIRCPGPLRLLGVWLVCYIAAYAVAGPKMWSWYALPVQYGVATFSAIGGAWILKRYAKLFRLLTPVRLAVSVAAGLPIAWSLAWALLGSDRVTTRIYEPLRLYCTDHVSKGETILAGDIGVIGYACLQSRIYDTAALVWPEALTYRNALEIIADKGPDILFLVRSQAGMAVAQNPAVASRYTVVSTFTIRDSNMVPNRWVQEYVLLQKK